MLRVRAAMKFLLAMLLIASLGGLSSTAEADPWGDSDNSVDGTGPHPDGSSHSFCYTSTITSASGIAPNIVDAEYDALEGPAVTNVTYHSVCDPIGSTETDVVWRRDNLGGSTTGSTTCDDFNNGICDQAYITLDQAQIHVGGEDEIDETQTACHELGHTGGLTHGSVDSDCMINSADTPPTGLQYRRYGTHHRGHIDSWFG